MGGITAIGYDSELLLNHAKALAQQLHLVVDNQVFPRLGVTNDKLVLMLEGCSPLFVDFSPSVWQKRREAGKKQGLVRACKPRHGMRILDATAGWGRDAVILASFGAEVLMLERQPVMAALLEDGLRRYHAIDSRQNHLTLSLLSRDAKDYLSDLDPADYPDVIYIDPMHPLRQKSALVKKDMQALQQIIGVDQDASALVALAMSRVRDRVVVKWPQQSASLFQPNLSIPGKTVRFDVYFAELKFT